MKRIAAMVAGVLLVLVPLQFFWGLRPLPEYRTGTFDDIAGVVVMGTTLYGGVLAGIFALWRMEPKLRTGLTGRGILVAGVVGALAAIFVALGGWAVIRLLTTGRVMEPGQTLALMPLFPILGGLLSAFIAGGAALIAYALRLPKG